MGRARASSSASTVAAQTNQELGNMYDYLAKIILLGPSGAGKSCLLHRFIHSNWRVLSSQTIGVEFASKIISIGSPPHRRRIKLQLWDTAGTERFRSVSRSYYRGAAGAVLVYDVSSWRSFDALQTFLDDARALASRDLTVVLAGNKSDVVEGVAPPTPPMLDVDARGGLGSAFGSYTDDTSLPPPTPSSQSSRSTSAYHMSQFQSSYTIAPEGREVPPDIASRWAGEHGVPVAVEVSALSGDGVNEVFERLARMILTKIELGEIDPDDPSSGIQYGDLGWGMGDDGSVRSGREGDGVRRRKGRKKGGNMALREWEEVFRLGPRGRRGCC